MIDKLMDKLLTFGACVIMVIVAIAVLPYYIYLVIRRPKIRG